MLLHCPAHLLQEAAEGRKLLSRQALGQPGIHIIKALAHPLGLADAFFGQSDEEGAAAARLPIPDQISGLLQLI